MKNRILSLTRNTIPYVKELQPLAYTVAGCILMQQLDYWFERKPEGFYKFLEPPQKYHNLYHQGDSWVEELWMTAEEFRTAFDRIGIRYKSKRLYEDAPNKFQGKYYCSYFDRRENLTYYFRNHDLVDLALDNLVFNKKEANTVYEKIRYTVNRECSVTADGASKYSQIDILDLQEVKEADLLKTENTYPEITQIPQLQPNTFKNSVIDRCESELVFPSSITDEERVALTGLIENIPTGIKQEMLDELSGAIQAGVIYRGNVPFVRGLLLAFRQKKFFLNLGVSVLASRNAVIRRRAVDEHKASRQTEQGKAAGISKIREVCPR